VIRVTGRGGRRGGRLGLLGLGGYGVVLCLLGVAGLAVPARHAVPPPPVAPSVALIPPSTGTPPAAITPTVVPPHRSTGTPARGAAHRPSLPGEFRPLLVRLPFGRSVPIVPVGLDDAGALAIPADPQVVGWWTGGALAGEPFGSTVIAGHVDSRTQGIGAFAQLLRVRPGDVVELAAGTRTIGYWVTSVTMVPKARLSATADPFRQDVANRLIMITCGGPFDRARHSYRDNVVIVAVPVA